MRISFRFPLLALASALLASCGSGSSDPVDVQGVWTGGSDSLFVSSGRAYGAFQRDVYGFVFVASNGDTTTPGYFLTLPPFHDASSFQGDSVLETTTDDNDYFVPAIGQAAGDSFSLYLSEDPTDPRRETDCGGMCAQIDLHRTDFSISNPSVPTGTWQGYLLHSPSLGVPAIVIDVTGSGGFTGTDSSGCAWSGTIGLIEPGKNLFSVKAASSCPRVTYTGVGFEAKLDLFNKFAGAQGTYFYLGMSMGPTGGDVFAEFKIQ